MSNEQDFLVQLSTIKRRKLKFLWRPYFPYGLPVVMDGHPNIGKSFLLMHLAAQVSVGGKMPDGTPVKAGNVFYLGNEDDNEVTMRFVSKFYSCFKDENGESYFPGFENL